MTRHQHSVHPSFRPNNPVHSSTISNLKHDRGKPHSRTRISDSPLKFLCQTQSHVPSNIRPLFTKRPYLLNTISSGRP